MIWLDNAQRFITSCFGLKQYYIAASLIHINCLVVSIVVQLEENSLAHIKFCALIFLDTLQEYMPFIYHGQTSGARLSSVQTSWIKNH